MTDDDSPEPTPRSDQLLGFSRIETTDSGESVFVKSLEHLEISDRGEFRRHFESLARLDHPHLARYRDCDVDAEPVEVIQEFVDGTEFMTYLRRTPELEEIRTLQRRLAEEGRGVAPTDEPESREEPEAEAAESSTEAESEETGETEPPEETDEGEGEADKAAEAEAPSLDPGAASAEDEKAAEPARGGSERGDLLSETPVPDTHRYADAEVGDESPDVVFEPPEEDQARKVHHIDVVFLRLERLVPQILGALEYLHRFRQAHGTLKPTNVLVDSGGRCKLVDFGLLSEAQLVQENRSDYTGSKPPDEILEYARAYLAPECRANFEPSPEADLYALGCILFEAITGCRPYDAGRPDAVVRDEEGDGEESRPISEELDSVEEEREREEARADRDGELTPDPDRRYALRASALSELEPRCPAAWTDLILRLLDSNPERRPDYDEIRDVLASSRGRSVDIPPSFIPEQQEFFGRDEIFERLVDRAHDCVDDATLRATILTGPAGFGKTALAERLGHWAARRGWVVLHGRCYEQESLIYQGWNDIASELGAICDRAAGELDEQTERLRRRAARLFPELHPDGAPEEPLDRLEAISAFRELLRVVASERPILLLIDDLNSANPDSTALLADLIAEPEGLQCMVISTWRFEDAEPSHSGLPDVLTSAPAQIDRIDVRGFRRAEAEAYVDTVADLEPELRERVLEIGASNPLLLKELIYQIHLRRSEEESPGSEETSFPLVQHEETEENLEDPNRPTGEKLADLIRDRLDGLSRRETFLVQVLSIVSLPIPESIISFVIDQEFHSSEELGTSIRPLLDRLRTKRLVEELPSRAWERTYTLFHNLTRRLVLDDIPVQHYTHLCDHLADGLRRLWSDAEELRFEYLLRAERTNEAVDAAVRTARSAASRFAYHRSAKMWRWLGEQQDQTATLTSLDPDEELARVEFLGGRFDRAATVLHRLAEQIPADVARAQLKLREFRAHLSAGRRREAIDALEEALDLFGDRYEQASFLQKFSEWKNRAVAATQRWSDDPDEVTHEPLGGTETLRLKLYRNVILKNDVLDSTRGERFRAKFSALAEQSRDALLIGYDRLFLAHDCHYYGVSRSTSRAGEWYDETEELFEIAGDGEGLAQTALGRAGLLRSRGTFDEAEEWVDTAADRLQDSEPVDEREHYAVDYERAQIHRERGDLEAAIRRAEKLRHFHRGDALATFRANQVLLPVRLLRGEVSHAELLVEECDAFLEGAPLSVGTIWLARQRTRMNLGRGRPEVAQGLLDVLAEQLQGSGLFGHPYVDLVFPLSRAQAAIAELTRKDRIGEPRRGELFESIKRDVEAVRNHSTPISPPFEAEVQRLLARFELLRDDASRAFDHLDRATDALARYPSPIARSMCVEAQGMALQQDEPDQGASMIEQSRVIYEHHDCHYPLVLEGWPVTERMSKLLPDAQASS